MVNVVVKLDMSFRKMYYNVNTSDRRLFGKREEGFVVGISR